jgi:hypothetical protein
MLRLFVLLFLFISAFTLKSAEQIRLFIPGLNTVSQSNVNVFVSSIENGVPCPIEYTNILENTNLFTSKQQNILRAIFTKYANVTTNSGPQGTRLASLVKTNFVIEGAYNRSAKVENWIARYDYTNSEDHEVITIGRSLRAEFRNKFNDGYDVFFNRTGSGTLLGFAEVKRGELDGILVEFNDGHSQGTSWNFRRADFSEARLFEYKQFNKGFVLGRYFMWNPSDGRLLIHAEFKEPYDWKKNYHPMPMRQK